MSQTYKLKFMFDWGSGVCLWSANPAAEEKLGDYPVEVASLSISPELKEELERLIEWHDEALNWDDPAGDLLWNENQMKSFMSAAQKAYVVLCSELGADYDIEFYAQI